MDPITSIVLLTLLAGATMPLGAAIARIDACYPGWLNSETRHGIMAFGGGALVSAVALVLVPEGSEKVSVSIASIAFLAGGFAFLGLDIWLARSQSPMGQLAAMLSDFVPEALALGAAFATGESAGLLLAILIGLQNLPEGFNAYREITSESKLSGNKVLFAFAMLSLLGPTSGLIGYFYLSTFPAILGTIMLFASGGILYVVFQDIAPNAKLESRWLPALGAVTGFLLGLIGNMVTG